MAQELIWLHPDCLSLTNLAFVQYPERRAVFVFDDEEIEAEQWSLKRIGFLYECLLEMPVDIRRGDVVVELSRAMQAYGSRRLVTVHSVNPRFARQRMRLEAVVPVEVLPAEPFVDYRGSLDLKRFSRYWKRVEPVLMDK